MSNFDYYNLIRDKVSNSTNRSNDTFVGIIYKDDKLEIKTPLGYDLKVPTNDLEKRNFRDDLKLLIYIIKNYYELRDKDDDNARSDKIVNTFGNELKEKFPIYSYDYLIQDYISNGYYFEKETIYKETNNGKINWNRTIKREKSYIDNDNIFFLKFIRRKTNILGDELITLLHKTCVYESFEKWGFMYFDKNISEKPQIDIKDAERYIPIIKSKLAKTFSDRYKMLFTHMINVIEHNAKFSEKVEYKYGVDYFHPVWEMMIDKVFGISKEEKANYYPSAEWHIINKMPFEVSNLRPDTIMKYGGDTYVLDAKYYGKDDNDNQRLPATSDINKQITYGKHVEEVDKKEPYNAFLIPSNNKERFKFYGYADIDKVIGSKSKKYARVSTIQVNTKELMKLKYAKASNEINKDLTNEIKKVIDYTISESQKDLEIKQKFEEFKNVKYAMDKKLAAHIDLSMFSGIYEKIGSVIDKFIKDNK